MKFIAIVLVSVCVLSQVECWAKKGTTGSIMGNCFMVTSTVDKVSELCWLVSKGNYGMEAGMSSPPDNMWMPIMGMGSPGGDTCKNASIAAQKSNDIMCVRSRKEIGLN